MGNQVLYPHVQNYTYGDHRTHVGIPVCIRAGIAKIFAYGDPRSHNKIVRIRGVTYTWETLFLYFKHKHICHFDMAHSSAHEGSNHALKAHTAGIKPTMDLDTSAKTINTQTNIKVAELKEIIYRDVYL
jgi:hypothetical protein